MQARGPPAVGRSVHPELVQTDYELGRFIRAQEAEARRLGYPREASFARNIARGTLSVAPMLEDPVMEAVGEFYFQHLGEVGRFILAQKYTGVSEVERARAAGVSRQRLSRVIHSLLHQLKGYLAGALRNNF